MPPSGPFVTACPEVASTALSQAELRAVSRRALPLLVRGLATGSVPVDAWSFEELASRLEATGCGPVSAQNGLIEQGATNEPLLVQPAAYLRALGQAERSSSATAPGLGREGPLPCEGPFELDWAAVARSGDATYLAQLDLFARVPQCRAEGASLLSPWPRCWSSFNFCWIGPAGTLTGLHRDMPDNWFYQLRGVKELVLFPPSQAALLPTTAKHDFGAVLCAVDVTRLTQTPDSPAATQLRQARGLYARLGPGDALFVPRGFFHLVLALTPSCSLSSFGHSPGRLLSAGLALEMHHALHRLGLWRWGDCTCHRAGTRRPVAGGMLLAVVAAVGFAAWRRKR